MKTLTTLKQILSYRVSQFALTFFTGYLVCMITSKAYADYAREQELESFRKMCMNNNSQIHIQLDSALASLEAEMYLNIAKIVGQARTDIGMAQANLHDINNRAREFEGLVQE